MYTQPSLHPSASSRRTNNKVMPLASSLSAPASLATSDECKTRVSIHDILDSTTLEIGFDQTCLEGLTAELLYSPIDAFAQSCWEILFPEPLRQPQPPVLQQTVIVTSDPPLYTPCSEIYTIPEASGSQSTVRQGDAESSIRFVSANCFWDDSDDDDAGCADDADDEAELEEEEEEEETSSFGDDDSEEGSSLGFSHSDAIKDHPIIDTNIAVGDDLFLHDLSDWKSSFVSWENSLPLSFDFRETPISDKTQKSSRMAALRAKIPILPFRSSTTVHNPWY